jgi:D-glycero-D-manno-heptose 1,7-bisphosphate phosphatase
MTPIVKLVILDRDGLINETRDDYVKTPEEWEPIPGALEAIARLNHAGWHAVVASNQSGIGRGLFDMATLNAMHVKMHQLLAKQGGRIDAVFFCPHGPDEGCDCRKPLPGLFLQIGLRYGVDLGDVPAVGAIQRHLQAGAAAGAVPHLVRSGKAAQMDEREIAALCEQLPGTTVHADLNAFAEWLIRRDRDASGKPDSGPGGLN